MSDNPAAIWYGLAVLAFVALALDAAIRDKPGKWSAGDASAQDVARIYAAAAQERGYPGVTELIEALLADWPAILAPVAHEPKGAVTGAQDFPFGGTF